jgi:hypothetical protein
MFVVRGHVLGGLSTVEAVKLIQFDDLDESFGVSGQGCIAASFQTTRPSFVVTDVEVEEGTVAASLEKAGMVFVAVTHGGIDAEAVVFPIVVVVGAFSLPIGMALDTEVVVGFPGQFALPCPTLEKSLRQCNAGRDAVFLHLGDSKVFVLIDIVHPYLIFASLSPYRNTEGKEKTENTKKKKPLLPPFLL